MFQNIKAIFKKAAGLRRNTNLTMQLSTKDQELISQIREKKLTYLSDRKLARIAKTCHALEEACLPGMFIEAGCALGGSSILIASLKNTERSLFVYDVFGMIPPPTEEDTQDVHERYQTITEGKSQGINGDKYYGYEDDLLEVVISNFKSFEINADQQSISLIKGLVQNTMTIEQPVAFAHIDVDWYDPVMTCLKRIFPRLVSGGIIILDDYHAWGGCRKATNEYLLTVTGQYSRDDSDGSLKLTKI